ncbi:hypothetical protein T4B_8469 [Trichinella pseudospiralis]|uniref:Uncharacterized protein n=1 Tax=Trichinella pseudospiralis TaxID=6337 RepID=A0A0V1GK94_TRIPS|nr:hypothetical protein T4B_8469 [Trichinella pseudospiralis]
MKHCIHKYVNPLDRIVRWSITFVGQIQVSEDTLDAEDTFYRSRA